MQQQQQKQQQQQQNNNNNNNKLTDQSTEASISQAQTKKVN